MFIPSFPNKISEDISKNLVKLGLPDQAIIELAKALDLLIIWGAINSDELKSQNNGEDLEKLFYSKVEGLIVRNDH